MNNISIRGNAATKTVLRSDLKVFFESMEDMWHASDNPNGKFPLNMAENNLCWDLLKPKIESILSSNEIPDWTSNYTGMVGSDSFLNAMASFFSRHLARCSIDPSHLATSAGATAVIELTSWILCDSGDVAVFPAPSYPVYSQDINNKSGVQRFDLITHYNLNEIQNGSYVGIQELEKVKLQLKGEGKSFKLLVLTNPDNPTGSVYSLSQLEKIANWCIHNEIHLVVNELYGLSKIDVLRSEIKEDYLRNISFQSLACFIQEQKSDYLHVIYGLSKDFGISGFRVGMVYSLNEKFLVAYNNLNAPHMVSNITQWICVMLFSDEEFISNYIEVNQSRLTDSYIKVILTLKELNIPYVPARGSLFVWLDLSEFLINQSEEDEQQLWNELYNEAGILLTPGIGFGHSKKGQFRLVFSFLPVDTLSAAMDKLENFVLSKRNSQIVKAPN